MLNRELANTQSTTPPLGSFIKYALASFFFLHLLGFFGAFIGLAYPLWWFFFPQKTLCFFCLHTSFTDPNGTCPVCKRKIETIYDPPFRAILANMISILLLTVLSWGVLYVEFTVITHKELPFNQIFNSRSAKFLIPQQNTFTVHKESFIDIDISNPYEPINVIQADLKFDTDLIEITRIESKDSIARVLAQQDYSNTEGWIRVIGGIPNPGYFGEKGHFARVYFYPKKTGAGQFDFLPSSRILANDGKGSNILYEFSHFSIVIVP